MLCPLCLVQCVVTAMVIMECASLCRVWSVLFCAVFSVLECCVDVICAALCHIPCVVNGMYLFYCKFLGEVCAAVYSV